MSYIHVTVDEQTLHITDSPKIAAQGVNENYIVFDFDATWSGFSKVALFYREGDESQVYQSLIVNNEAVVPHEVTDQEGKICFGICGVKGDKVYTSEILKYKIVKGLYTAGQESEPPTPGIYEQMLQSIAAMLQSVDVVQNQVDNLVQNYNVQYGSKILWEGELYWPGSSVVPWDEADLTRTLSDDVYDFDFVDIYIAINSSSLGTIGRFLFTLPKVEAGLQYPILFTYGSRPTVLETENHNLSACRFTVEFPTSTSINLRESAIWLWNGSISSNPTINRLGGHGFVITKVVGRKVVANAEVTDIRIGVDGTVYESAGAAVRAQIEAVSSGEGGGDGGGSSGDGLTSEVKTALLNLLSHVAYDHEDDRTYYDALYNALYPPVNLVSISAVFDQGDNAVYDTDTLESLEQYLTVTAHYSDNTTGTISDYTLSGTLAVGISTITVSYGGKTTTFTVTVSAQPLIPAEYQQIEYVQRPSSAGVANFANTGVSLSGVGDVVINAVFMQTAANTYSANIVGIRENISGSNTSGLLLGITADEKAIRAWHGDVAQIDVADGETTVNKKYDVTATYTSNGCSITDGESTAVSDEYEPKDYKNQPICIFGRKKTVNQVSDSMVGNCYYVKVTEDDVVKVELIPCTRKSDDAVGFYNKANNTFITNSGFVAGPNVGE